MVQFIRSDLEFILQQILIAEGGTTDPLQQTGYADPSSLLFLLPNDQVPWGLRTVDGSYNNLVFIDNTIVHIDQTLFGAADTVFPRSLTPTFRVADPVTVDLDGPGGQAVGDPTSYAQTSGVVFDAEPRIISNLIVDQTAGNPAAVAAAAQTPNSGFVTSPGLDGIFGTADDRQVEFIPNVAPNAGLSAPFNAWFTFFGQFFDHGLDLVTKGGQDIVFIPLQADDPLVAGTDGLFGTPDDLPPQLRFMVETRATNVAVHPGPDGQLGTADDIHDNQNTTTPFVDQNQTYTSHPSHQVFLRAYQLLTVDPDGNPATNNSFTAPFNTGKLITNKNLGADGHFGGTGANADTEIGGMATWGVVKAQARDLLGITLSDAQVGNVPLLATDAYGNFIAGPHGFPQLVVSVSIVDSNGPTPVITPVAGNFLAEGKVGGLDINHLTVADLEAGHPALPALSAGQVFQVSVVGTGHQFLIDINDGAAPVTNAAGVLQPDADTDIGNEQPRDPLTGQKLTYDDELLNAHYIAGDGRANENIGLTAVHSIFHSEHNRLIDQAKVVLITDALQTHDVSFLNKWLMQPITVAQLATLNPDTPDAGLIWNGQSLFQVGRFGTEMQYQHLVFEEFARTIDPNVDEFLAPLGYDTTINPAIVAEFAHTVYRFGHSMLTETVDRFDPNFNLVNDPNSPDHQLGLIAAFLNPLEFVASGPTPEQAVGAIVRGVTRSVGNAIDEFITEALRNNLLGTPLDLAVLNLARGRDTGIPSLNEARREFYAMTSNNDVGDSNMKPYVSWVDFMEHLRHPESLINFIAAYGTHSALLDPNVDTLAEKRAVAAALVLGGSAQINNPDGTLNHIFTADEADRLAFLNSTDNSAAPGGVNYSLDAIGRTTTGVDLVDFWVGGLAEAITPFNSMLGSTFNFVFENQLEALQNGDRFYYLARTAGLNFGTELENSLFSQLVMLNTDATHLPANIFSTPTWTLEVDPSKQFTGLGPDGRADPTTVDDDTGGIVINGHVITPVVVRDNPNTPTPDTNYLQYIGENHIVLGGSANNDILIAGDGDDTAYGDGGNDRIEGGAGDDQLFGGAGDDIITDMGGLTVMHGEAGNDVLIDSHATAGAELANILLGGDGKDFIATWDDINIVFGGAGDDFIYGSKPNLPETGNEGDDWIELGTQDGSPGDNFSPLLLDDVPGNDIFVGGGGFDEMIGEGGDDIFVGSDAQDKMDGMSGFDWVTYKNDKIGVTVDLELAALNEPPVAASPASILDRFAEVEGLSGSRFADYLRGSEADANEIATFNAKTSALDAAGIARVAGLQTLLNDALGGTAAAPITGFGTGNIILGGDGSDIILGMGGDDLIDGDKWLNVRVSVHQNVDGTGPQIASYDSLAPLIPLMLNGTYNPGQLVATREIMNGVGGFDTAVYRGNIGDYIITINNNNTPLNFSDDVVTVADNRAAPIDGIDHLTHMERLVFQDATVDLVPGLDAGPVGRPTITDTNGGAFTVGDLVTVSIAGVTDADNPNGGAITGPVRYTWQVDDGTGVFDDIILLPGGDLAFESASGTSFRLTPDLAGLSIRVKAIYTDAHGVTEMVFSDATAAVEAAPAAPLVAPPTTPDPSMSEGGPGIKLVRSDLDFILDQIKIAEQHAENHIPLTDLIPNIRLAYGLRAVDGSENNLLNDGGFNQTEFGAADTTFPRLLPPQFNTAENGTSYAQTSGTVIDSQPRVISNLVVDQTSANPAAYASAYDPGANGVLDFNGPAGDDVLKDGVQIVKSPGLDGKFGTDDDRDVFYFPNVTPDAGLGAPFNAWFTFFGQFFDHGLDLVTKGGNGSVFIPLKADDPLVAGADGLFGTPDDLPPQLRFMIETRATMQPGPDGILGTPDDIHEHENTTTPFVDQNQTYTSHPSHQVFLRAYQLVLEGADSHQAPIATGKLITNKDLGADGHFGGTGANADTEIGGMATWKVVKAQARDLLGINLTDKDFDNVPLLATDQYGNFIPGAHGLPQVVMRVNNGPDGIAGNADDVTTLVEGNLAAPIDLTNAVRTGHQFLIDVAHNAVPVFDAPGHLAPDADTDIGNPQPFNPATGQNLTYDDELLDAHYIAGDGRVNENIGLTSVHAIFHAEHNRLVDQVKDTILHNGDLAFLNEWLLTPVASLAVALANPEQLIWNGERLFQAAKFGTEMQYQHLVFEEFARTVQPAIDPFFAPTQVYDVDLNPAIVAEFAHTVYRFGHSMLTETVDRFDTNFNIVDDPNSPGTQQLGLIAAFLNPLAYVGSGATPEEATSAIIRGVTRTVGNEIDEFVTEALRNNLLGTPLDLAVLNLARGRDTGIPSLNAARRDFYTQTGDTWVKPYTSWADMVQHLKHPESLVNFIAAYGTHEAITSALTLADKRAAALLLVLGDGTDVDGFSFNGHTYTDRLDFLNSTGTWANNSAAHTAKDRDGVTTTGLGSIDFWVGGLAEAQMPFGGLLGSTFNFVFEAQLEKLQDGDRFYYLERTSGLSFGNELESNSFAKLIMANTNLTHLPAEVFTAPAFTLEVDQSKQFNAHTGVFLPGPDGILVDDPLTPVDESADNIEDTRADPTGGIMIGTTEMAKLVIRDDPSTPGLDTHFLHYTGEDHVVLGGTSGDDTLISSIGDDTLWGDEGSDHLDGGYGDDNIRGGAGDDFITDMGGLDNIQGGDGNDYIQGGGNGDLILGGFGNDFIVTGEDNSEAFGGAGDDFILGNKSNEQDIGNEGDDWIEKGTSDGAPGDNFDPLGNDPIPGNDIFLGDGENDKFIGEGGDDIMVGSKGLTDRFFGASGFDWATYKNDDIGVTIDFSGRFFDQPPVPGSGASNLARFDIMEGLSGSSHDDYLSGDDAVDLVGGEVGAGVNGSALVNIGLINGLQQFLDTAFTTAPNTPGHVTAFTTGNIILGGDGSDFMMGRGGDDIIDGDAWLNVRIGVWAVDNVNHTGDPLASYNTMQEMVPLVANGTIKISQLKAIREIVYASGPDFDTAKFSGNLADYTFKVDGVDTTAAALSTVGLNHVFTVTDTVGSDGSDKVMHVERLQFADQSVVLGGLNHAPGGLLTLAAAAQGSPVTVQNLLTDADNVTPTNPSDAVKAPVAYFWQVDDGKGFVDITAFAAGEIARAEGATFTPTEEQVGLPIRVRAVYIDGNGVLEEAFSNAVVVANVNDPATGAPGISDTSPTETLPITASLGTIADLDGLPAFPAGFTFQWQQANTPGVGGGGISGFSNIVGANAVTFTPTDLQVNRELRVVVSFVDAHGTPESRTSAPTTVVGDFIAANAAAQGLTGNEGDDLIFGGAGADVITSLGGSDTIDGGIGNDLIDTGAGNDTINYTMGQGADTVIGGPDLDLLNIIGTAGADALDVILTGAAITNVEGGTISGVEQFTADLLGGTNSLNYGTTAGPVTVNLTSGSASGFLSVANIQNVTGGNGNDLLTGAAGSNVLSGGNGDDTFFATTGDGNDTLNGGLGTDTYNLSATTGGATITTAGSIGGAATGTDVLNSIENIIGSQGNDTIIVNGGVNVLDGQGGNDVISAGGANDTVSGGSGDDLLNGEAGNDTLNGDLGNDTIVGGAGNDVINGGAGSDTVNYNFGDGADTVNDTGASGTDVLTIVGTGGNDILDVILSGTSLSAFEGGTIAGIESVTANLAGGTDTLSYVGTTANVNVNLTGLGSASGFTSIAGIENVTGGSGNDTLVGNGSANTLNGGAGNDDLTGTGNDQLIGGAGNDTYHAVAGDNITEAANAGTDLVITSSASFTLAINVENLTFTGAGGFTGTGNNQDNVITGATGNDVLSGANGSDRLIGGDGADTLNGGNGTDVIDGGAGNDRMTGGNNGDTFVFAAGFGSDVITDFDANGTGTLADQDLLDVAGITAGNFAANVHIVDLGNDTQVTVDGFGVITLTGVNGVGNNIITQADFLLH